MLNRALKTILLSVGISGMVYLLACMSPGGPKEPAAFNGRDVSVQAKTAFRFEDFGLTIPRVASVLSVEDDIRLETDLLLRHSS